MVPSAEHPKLFVILRFKPAVGQKLDFHASRTASSYSCPKSSFPAQSSLVFFLFSHPQTPVPPQCHQSFFVTSNPLQGVCLEMALSFRYHRVVLMFSSPSPGTRSVH